MSESEKFQIGQYCRVSATLSRTIFDVIDEIAEHMDFRHPRFRRRMKRNRSAGSAAAFVLELALTDPDFVEKIKKFMIDGGKHYTHKIDYMDRYF